MTRNAIPKTLEQYASALALAERRLERSERARAAAEAMLELRGRALAAASRELERREDELLQRLEGDAHVLLNAQDVANVATFRVQADGTILGSRNLAPILGLKAMVTDIGQIGAMVHPVERAETRHFLSGLINGVSRRDIRILDQYGMTRWLRWHIRPDTHAQGHFHGAVQDITDQRALERRQRVTDALRLRQLRKLERLSKQLQAATAAQQRDSDFLRAVLETVPQGITVFDENLRLVIWNRRFTELYSLPDHFLFSGMDRDEFSAIAWPTAHTFQRLSGEDQGKFPIALATMLCAPGDYVETLQDGRSIEVRIIARDNGGIIKSYTDITDYVAAQNELRHRGELLAERIAELEAVGARLEESRDLAIKADRAKSRFLAMMSHDIRTPMNAILAMLELLSTTDLSPDQRNLLALARSSGDQMLFLLADIIEVARADGWSVDLEDQVVALPAFFTTIVDSWRPLARRKGLSLVMALASDLPDYISIDPKRLRQLLDNLISNAIKFTVRGSIEITVDLASGKDGPRLHMAVIDTGRGIEPKRQQTLFRDMRRVHSPMDADAQGNGLGLSICSRIVHAMKGRIGVESFVDVGSTFWVILPFAPAQAPKEAKDPASSIALEAVRIDGRPPHLLVAEDVATNQIVIAAMLEKLGCTSQMANDGLEALNLLKQGIGFDAVLMDVSMPTLDGLEATRAIRSMGGDFATLPILGVTAFAAQEELAAMRAAGMNDVLTKPIQLERLHDALDRIRQLRQQARTRSKVAPVPVPTFTEPPLVDLDQLRGHFLALPLSGRRRLEETVVSDLEHWTGALFDALSQGDEQAIARARHTLKGICAAFGANALWESASHFSDLSAEKMSGSAAGIKALLDATISQIRDVASQPDRRTA